MAKCKNCGQNVVWATVSNGKEAGKKRPFDPKGKTDGGKYGLKATEELDAYDNQVIEATYYDDPMKGLAENDELFDSHFFTCPAKGDYKGSVGDRLPALPNTFAPRAEGNMSVSVQLNGVNYSGTLVEDVPF